MYRKDEKIYERQDDIPFYKGQTRLVLNHCGHIDSESIEEYIVFDGYKALGKALSQMEPEDVIKEISASKLRGRGGQVFRQVIN